MKKTNEQDRIINIRGKNLLVSASAGCGKTFTMTERIIDIIDKKDASVKELLVLTFTNAVASEMKQKIYEKVTDRAKSSPHLVNQINDIHSANISTFHVFCKKIITEYFYILGVDPSFKLITDSEVNVIKDKAFSKTIEEISNNPKYSSLIEFLFDKRSEKNIKKNVIDLYDYLVTIYDYENHIQNMFLKTYNNDLKNNIALNYLKTELMKEVDYFYNLFNKMLDECNCESLKKVNDRLSELTDYCEEIIKNYDPEKNIRVSEDSINKSFPRLEIKKLTDSEIKQKEEIHKSILQFRKTIKEYNSIIEESLLETKNNILSLSDQVSLFIEITLKFKENYDSLKNEENFLDINDLEQNAIKVLKDNLVIKDIKEKFKYIFIDEYQDVNKTQEKIIELISRKNNVFFVGDLKQCIYKFRQSDPKIFLDRYKFYKKNTLHNDMVELNKNFRSESSILGFINHIFSKIMTKETTGIDYKNTSIFDYGADYLDKKNKLPFISINLIKKDNEEKELDSDKVYSVKEHYNKVKNKSNCIKEPENILICNKIKEYLGKEIYDFKKNIYRKIEPRDMVVLTRKGKVIKDISLDILKSQIDITAKLKFDLNESIEVLLINNYLRLINNKNDDIALASVLISYIYKLDINDLSKIRRVLPKNTFYNAIKKYKEMYNDKISKTLKKLFSDIEKFNFKRSYMMLDEIILDIMTEFKLYEYFAVLPGGKNRIENINFLVGFCGKFSSSNSLSAYLNYIDSGAKDNKNEISYSTDSNSVTISTMHSSKGLEYPVVIIANCSDDLTKQSNYNAISYNDDIGISMDLFDFENRTKQTTFIKHAIKLKNLQEKMEEEMRLLYVALSRAKNHLCIIGDYSEDIEDLNSGTKIKKTKKHIDMILGSLDENVISRIKLGEKNINYKKDGLEYMIKIFDEGELVNQDSSIMKKYFPSKTSEKDNMIKKILNYKYDNIESTGIVGKSTVSEILKEKNSDEDGYFYSIKRFNVIESFNKNDDNDFTEIGKTYHKIMEKIDFNGKLDIKDFVRKLIKSGEINESSIDFINFEEIEACVKKMKGIGGSGAKYMRELPFVMNVKYSELFKDSSIDDLIMIQGVVDLVIIDKDENVYVIDYKTSRISNEIRFKKIYETQLSIYKMAVEKALNIRVKNSCLYSFYLNKCINV